MGEEAEVSALRRELVECYTYLAHFQQSEEKDLRFFAAISDAIFMFDLETDLSKIEARGSSPQRHRPGP